LFGRSVGSWDRTTTLLNSKQGALSMSLRLLSIPAAIIVALVVWLVSKAFPNVNHVTMALVLAFGLAGAFAFLYKGRRAKRY
jgi:hypothetical protein